MRWRRRRQDPNLLPALWRLKVDTDPRLASSVDDYILYAEIGKDRHKLTMDWYDRCVAAIEGHAARLQLLDELAQARAIP